jgi:hypothetical protein
MNILDIVNETLDIASLKQARDIQKNVSNILQFIDGNKTATAPIAKDASNLNTSFSSLLAASQEAVRQELEEKKKKENDDKKKKTLLSGSRAGIGTTIHIGREEQE